ncbi:hypothetical protein KI387_006631 [Taxus chinensis]|uniref:Uncharacterized protein n=1 Tax=Taxus chinensis TaxID=29808 RepID=A0AA38GQE9_TAXCH|nr:hypothetical protein KI387_006631 [Taxus chinensis]
MTDEDDDPNASIQADGDEKDRAMDWREEEYGDENLFGLFKADASDSTSEEDNLIEIELSEKQILKENEHEWRQVQGWATGKLNLIDLDYSDIKDQRL